MIFTKHYSQRYDSPYSRCLRKRKQTQEQRNALNLTSHIACCYCSHNYDTQIFYKVQFVSTSPCIQLQNNLQNIAEKLMLSKSRNLLY
jgi:hypothetical protein